MNHRSTQKIRRLDPERIKDEAISFAKIILFRYRLNGEIVDISQSALDLLDLKNETPETVRGKDIGTLFKHIEEPGTLRRATLETGEVHNFEYHFSTLCGDERWVYHSSFLVRDPKTDEVFVQVISQDITDIKQSAIALEASESRYRALAEMSQHGIAWVTGDPPKIAYANEALATILGVKRTELIGASGDKIWHFVHPEDLPGLLNRRRKRLAGKDVTFDYEARLLRADGAVKYVMWTLVPTQFGEKSAFQATIIDITDRRRKEEEAREAEAVLQQRQKLESLGVLAGGIAHDFNNLLTAISGGCDLALMGVNDPLLVKKHLSEVNDTTDRAAELCQSLLAYAGNHRTEQGPLSINALVKDTVPLINLSKSKKAQLLTELDNTEPSVLGDTTQLRQILLNLVTNASEALTGDAGTIRVTTSTATLESAKLREVNNTMGQKLPPGKYAVLKVSDTGIGMDHETLSRIFDPFFTTKFTGRGLGLAAVLGIVRGHSGGLGVETSPGAGTTFCLYLPLLAGEVERLQPKTKSDLVGWAGGLALVADDEEIVLSSARTMFELFGFEVITASDGKVAIAAFNERENDFKVAFLDVMMPEVDGVEVFKHIRARREDLPILMTSGYDAGNIEAELEGHARVDFLQKPYHLEVLAHRLKKLLS